MSERAQGNHPTHQIGDIGESAIVQQGNNNVLLQVQDARGAELLMRRTVSDALLARAKALLATLPLDAVPEPEHSLPPGSRMLLRPNRRFVGRERMLRVLARLLKS